MRTIESVLEIHGPCESLELSIVQIGLELAEIRAENETQIAYLSARAASLSVSDDTLESVCFGKSFLFVLFGRAVSRDSRLGLHPRAHSMALETAREKRGPKRLSARRTSDRVS